ncbi:MAG TPA: hypothetical protein VL728_00785 [Cyclobacteriaceae bacterium]|jgi:hypothetical protein|nr:hypothetical protein [Cyclobacteriaceae bacterium]
MSLKLKNLSTKLFNWEYWPFGIIQLPLVFMWLWYSLKERSFFYFTASNPGIYAGGMMGESKFEVLSMLPNEVKPKTLLVKHGSTLANVQRLMQENGLAFPVIFKPDLGERGWMVRKIKNEQDALWYLSEIKIDFLIQEFVELPLEFGVFYVRFPNEERGFVNSITAKEFLFVLGDGKKTLRCLIMENNRARLQWKSLLKEYGEKMEEIIPDGKKVELISIGNHCLGTKFLNANHLITEKLSASFDRISKQMSGFYFGRYDLRCGSIEDLENGKVKIVELNGCGAEPSHIYHPKASLADGVRDLIAHWKNLYRISRENHERGVAYISFHEGRSVYKKFTALRA